LGLALGAIAHPVASAIATSTRITCTRTRNAVRDQALAARRAAIARSHAVAGTGLANRIAGTAVRIALLLTFAHQGASMSVLKQSLPVTLAAAAAAALLALSATADAQPRYSIVDLAPSSCGVTAINDSGVVVGQCNDTAVIWSNGVPTTVGRLRDGTYSIATAISSTGNVVGEGDTGDYRPQGWVRTKSGLVNFFPNNGGNTHALFIADNGVIGGYYTKSLSGNTASWRGAIWTPDPKDARKYRTTDLPVLPGGADPKYTGSLPMAFNRAGQAAGWATNDVIGQHAVLWNNDGAHSIRDLGTLPGDWSSIAWAMNDLGQVVGESHPPFGSRPVLWNSDAAHTATALPLLPGDNYGSAHTMNNPGDILGFSTSTTPGTWNVVGAIRPVLWHGGTVFELQSLLDATSGAGWTITSTAAMNNVGQIIGYGMHDGAPRAFVMTPLD
jgi:uncharacterized membrane protein